MEMSGDNSLITKDKVVVDFNATGYDGPQQITNMIT